MTDAWAIVAAGLGGSAITGAVGWILTERQGVHARRGRQREERRKAYSELLGYSALVAQQASALHLAMAVRSGFAESLDITLGRRRPIEPLELWSALRVDTAPLNMAWSAVWTVGSEEGIRLANALVDRCAALIGTATARGEGRRAVARLVAGEKWTQEQLDAWEAELHALGRTRRDLALLARRELGSEIAEVFYESPGATES